MPPLSRAVASDCGVDERQEPFSLEEHFPQVLPRVTIRLDVKLLIRATVRRRCRPLSVVHQTLFEKSESDLPFPVNFGMRGFPDPERLGSDSCCLLNTSDQQLLPFDAVD